MASPEEAKLELFLQWLEANKVELRGCKIKYCDSTKGFGIFSSNEMPNGVLLVVPLDLAVTPMRVLQDPLLGPECRAMFEGGEVDDRYLMILFLTVERLRKNSLWKPYLDMLPTSFTSPLWFTEDELLELKGTPLYRATVLQKRTLQSLYEDKVKDLVEKLLIVEGDVERANSVFWTRALNIPLPKSYVFPEVVADQENSYPNHEAEFLTNYKSNEELISGNDEMREHSVTSRHEVHEVDRHLLSGKSTSQKQMDTIWVEGLVPGIDFCNHDLKAAARWEVDGTGTVTGVPAMQSSFLTEREISISYGNKGNEELLYLYGFVIENNPDDYLMVHYPIEALQSIPFSECKSQLLEVQKAEMRCLLPRNLLDHGFFPKDIEITVPEDKEKVDRVCNYSWSGQRPKPSYLDKLVFPDDFLTALRTIAMQEDELYQVTSLLEELVGNEGERQPTDVEVRAAVWEVCGDSGAFQLLVDLLQTRMMDLEESSGTEDRDTTLLKHACIVESPEKDAMCEKISSGETNGSCQPKLMSRNKWSSIVYRQGQKQLTRLFLKEAEHALHLSLREGAE